MVARTLEELSIITGLSNDWSHSDLINVFGWYLHCERNQEYFMGADIGKCYEALHLSRPASFSAYIVQLEKKKDILRQSKGLRLAKGIRDKLDAKYGQHATTVQVRKILTDLPSKVPSVEEREFLREALICFKHKAYRAAIVMVWNLSFDHLCNFVLQHHLLDFNIRWPIRFPKDHPKCRISAMSKREDFSEIKESDVLEICRSASIITADVYKVLHQKLDTRNSAAHPSTLTFTELQVEEYISNLVNNVVLLLKL
jgi:hypothetical protein